jgi:nematocidal protein AidA
MRRHRPQADDAAETGEQSIIDLLLVVDAETLLATYPAGTPDQPVSVDQPLIYMMVRQGDAVYGEGTKELKIKARTLDVLRWRSTTLALDGGYSSLLYRFFTLKGADLLSPPVPLLAEVKAPLPNPAAPLAPATQTIQSYFWTSTVLASGSVTYAFYFMIVGRDGDVRGYFYWDPFITISN